MLKIAICDDNQMQNDILTNMISDFLNGGQIQYEIYNFLDPEELLKSKLNYDVYFLDINFPGDIDGISLGQQIKNKNEFARLIYISADPTRAAETLQLQAFCYLLKPIRTELMCEILMKIIDDIEKDFFVVQTPKGDKNLNIKNILYIEMRHKRLFYHLKDKTIVKGCKITNSFETALGPIAKHDYFKLIDNKTLINTNNVKVLTTSRALTKNKNFILYQL